MQRRNDGQPTQVLPLDAPDGLAQHCLRLRCARGAWYGRVYDGCEFARSGGYDNSWLMWGQGKWDMRGKRRGDLISEF